MKATWTHRDMERRHISEPVTVHAFLPMGPRTVVTDSFHGYTDQTDPTVVAVLECADGRLAWGFVTDLKVIEP